MVLSLCVSSRRSPLLDHQDGCAVSMNDGCEKDAEYITRCNHRFCEKHTILIGNADRWRCLEDKCLLYIDPNDFRRVSNEENITYEQIKTSAKFKVLGRVLVGLIGIGTFVGLTICLLNQEDDI